MIKKRTLASMLPIVLIGTFLCAAPVLAQPSGEPNGEFGDEEGEDPDASCTPGDPCSRVAPDPTVFVAIDNLTAACRFEAELLCEGCQDQELQGLYDCIDANFSGPYVVTPIDEDGLGIEGFSVVRSDGSEVGCFALAENNPDIATISANMPTGGTVARVRKLRPGDDPHGSTSENPYTSITILITVESGAEHGFSVDTDTNPRPTAEEVNQQLESMLVASGLFDVVSGSGHWSIRGDGPNTIRSVRFQADDLAVTSSDVEIRRVGPAGIGHDVPCGDPEYAW